MHWLSFGVGVLGTLSVEYLLALAFSKLSATDRARAEAVAKVAIVDAKPWWQKAEQGVETGFKTLEGYAAHEISQVLGRNGNANTTGATVPATPVPNAASPVSTPAQAPA